MRQNVLTLAIVLLVVLNAAAQDTNFYVFLCFGQSNMEGYPGIEEQDRAPVDSRCQVLATVNFDDLGRTKGQWYPAVPPLCRPSSGIGPADYFGRTLVAGLPPNKVKGIYDRLLRDLDLQAEDVPLLAGELVNADQGGVCAGMNAIIDELPKTIPSSHVISSSGCSSRPAGEWSGSPRA